MATPPPAPSRPAAPAKKPLIRLLDAAIDRAWPLTLLLVALGYVGLLLLPLAERPIKFDEKSLSVGMARPTLTWVPQPVPCLPRGGRDCI